MIGIYCIKNIITNKYYIGQSSDIKKRWNHHKRDLNNNSHHNKHLQGAWNKYGEYNFKFSVIEECSEECLDEKESYYISKYNSYEDGYNMDLGGGGCRGYKHTQDEIHKMRINRNPRAVLQLDSNKNIVNRWISSAHAAKTLGTSHGGIDSCCQKINRQKSIKGYIWVYEDDYNSNNVDWDYYLINNQNDPKRILQFDSDMNLLKTWESECSIERELHISSGEISTVCNYKRKSSHGFIWRFADDYTHEQYIKDCTNKVKRHNVSKKIVRQYDLDNKLIATYNSVSEAARLSGFSRCSIQSCCVGRQRTAHGFIWKFT